MPVAQPIERAGVEVEHGRLGVGAQHELQQQFVEIPAGEQRPGGQASDRPAGCRLDLRQLCGLARSGPRGEQR
ncbi:MAG: hypothetical protein ACK55I_33725, partial [bacterium]